jgi:hypothetical protein
MTDEKRSDDELKAIGQAVVWRVKVLEDLVVALWQEATGFEDDVTPEQEAVLRELGLLQQVEEVELLPSERQLRSFRDCPHARVNETPGGWGTCLDCGATMQPAEEPY